MSKKPEKRDLFESERRFRLLVEGVVDYAIYLLDPEGRVTNWNAGAQRIKGYSAGEIIGHHFGIFYTPEDRAAGLPEKSLQKAATQGKFEAEAWRVRKDGARFRAFVVIDALYEDGRLVGFAKITRDVTSNYKAQMALEQSERRFRLLVSGVKDYALYMLDKTGVITSWNAGGQQIKGYAPEEIVGEHFSRFYTESDRAAGKPANALRIALDQEKYEEEGWRVRKDGSFFWASVVIDPIHDDDGSFIGFAKITRDITERREAQRELARVHEQLAESQKMDALGQLTGGVAHDFNNLLMIVSGHIQNIKRRADDHRLQKSIQAIELAAQRGASLTRQLLSFSRHQKVSPQAIDVGERIGAVQDVLHSGIGHATGLLVDVAESTWPIEVDTGEFEIALANLAINSRDAMPQGGVLTISASNAVLTDPNLQGDFVAVTVSDTGSGIPPDLVDRIFDPFFTTKPVGKGTGLGLSQVHGFVHQAGGAVKVDSELGRGTRITMFFPRAANLQGRAEPASDAPTQYKGATVLLVEDNLDVASATIELLGHLGYHVRHVPDAMSALRELKQVAIDVVFSDIVMPGPMDGLGLLRTINEKYPELPVVLATGYSNRAATSDVPAPVLRKPYQIQDLSNALAKAIAGSRSN